MSILCYHSVDPAWGSHLAVTPEEFDQHCRWLSRSRTVLPLEQALTRFEYGRRLPRGIVAITFDDGYMALAEWAFPVLERHRLPATVFLIAETLTDTGHPVDWVDDPPPWALRTLTAEQVLAARTRGTRFASHSWAHRNLVRLSEEECVRDLRDSKESLEELLREPVRVLAYPFGYHDAKVERAAARAGYDFGLALPDRREAVNRYAVPRVGVLRGDGTTTIRLKSSQFWLPFRYSHVFPLVRKVSGRGAPQPARVDR